MLDIRSHIRWISENPFAALLLLVGFVSSVGGIMGIVEGWVRWHDFIANHFLDYYKALIRQPLVWIVDLVWPRAWPKLPGWLFDVVVLWVIAANATARYYFGAAAPHDIDMRRRMTMAAVFWPTYLARQIKYYRRNLAEKIAQGDRDLSGYEEWVMYKELARQKHGARRAGRFIAAVLFAITLLLALNYQLDLQSDVSASTLRSR